MSMADAVGSTDPTGILSAAGAAVGLVGTVLRTVPALKNANTTTRAPPGSSGGPASIQRTQRATSAAEAAADLERQRRAYETVNFVLRELGSRICAAGLVDEHALTKALTSATQHIDFNLFSGDANRLFASLAPKLGDPLLVNNIFTCIYFVGALTAELTRSLPNYKDSYTPLGPRIVQQLFRTAIGEDAFRENLTSNLDAYKTLATTAGLLRPTDIGYSAFPGFPAFSPCRYSNKSYSDVRNNKLVFEKIMKHFDTYGFPQPVLACQAEVGAIKEWRFISGDAPSRTVEVERADKNIGESFGRFLHWLICSADRLPPGQAIIAYYDQHIELIKWIGQRMGYRVLSARTDLDWSGNHQQLDIRIRAICSTWVILMPSEKAQATRRASSAQWAKAHTVLAMQPTPAQVPQHQPAPKPYGATVAPQTQGSVTSPPAASPSSSPNVLSTASQVPGTQLPIRRQSNAKPIDQRLDDVEREFNHVLLPQCNRFLTMSSTDPKARDNEYHRLTQHIKMGLICWLDGLPIPENHPAQNRRKAMIAHAQQVLSALDSAPRPAPPESAPVDVQHSAVELTGSFPPAPPPVPQTVVAASPIPGTAPTQDQPASVAATSPPPYSPSSPPSASSSMDPSSFPFPDKPAPKPVVRRRAPPPPKKLITAKALYDFEPDAGNEEELAVKEDDEIEIIEKTAALEEEGWCRARIKGEKKIGLVPLEYLEIEPKVSIGGQVIVPTSASGSSPQQPPTASAHGGQSLYGGVSPSSAITAAPAASASSMTQHPNSPAIQLNGQRPPMSNKKSGKQLEVAGLGIAAVGATAGVITVIQGSKDSRGNSNAQTSSEGTGNPQQPVRGDEAGIHEPNAAPQNDGTQNNGNSDQYAPPPPPNDTVSPTAISDPSSYSSPQFEPQPLFYESAPSAAVADVNYYPTPQYTDPSQTLTFDQMTSEAEMQPSALISDAYTPVSPFAALATPSSVATGPTPEYHTTPLACPIADEQTTGEAVFVEETATEEIVYDDGGTADLGGVFSEW